jgi:hypothetical protein
MKLIKEILAWFRNFKLQTPHAIVIGAIFIALALVIGAKLSPQKIWVALTAIGTICVVGYAVYREEYQAYRRRPVLEIDLFESNPPHLIEIPEINPKTKASSRGYYVTLKLTNIGKSIAERAQVLITAKGQYFYEDGWKSQENWIPISIRWILDEWAEIADKKPTQERALIPERPYLFHILGISSNQPSLFHLYPVIIPRHQSDKYPPGTYCFEVTAFALGAKTVKKYVHVEWKGEEADTYKEISERMIVSLKDTPAW